MFSSPAKERYMYFNCIYMYYVCSSLINFRTILYQAARPALNAASCFGHDDVVELLLDHGASVNAVDGVRTQSGVQCSLT